MSQTILDFAIIASVIIGYFTSIALITTSFYRCRANNYLSFALFLHASLILIEWYGPENKILSFLYYVNLDLVIGVILFTYFLSQIRHKFLKSRWHQLLYTPFICSCIIEIFFHSDTVLHLHESTLVHIVIFVRDNVSLGLNLFLMFWARKLIRRTHTISDDKKRWLLRLNLFLLLFMLSWLFARTEAYVFDSEYITGIPGLLISLFSWWILYYGVFRLQIVVQKDELHQYLVSKNHTTAQVKKKISSTTTDRITTQLYKLMDDEQLYKNPLLSRFELAKQLGTSEGYLSKIINQEINKTVIQFVNEYRIEDAKKLLHNPVFNKYSIEAIGMEVGFKSKSAFYNAFKTKLQMSPGAYRKLQEPS